VRFPTQVSFPSPTNGKNLPTVGRGLVWVGCFEELPPVRREKTFPKRDFVDVVVVEEVWERGVYSEAELEVELLGDGLRLSFTLRGESGILKSSLRPFELFVSPEIEFID